MPRINDDVIQEAVQTDIVDFCMANGYDLTKKSARYYFGVEHDSLVIDRQKNTYQWYSRGDYGNAINFVQTFFDVEFPEAVRMLTNGKYEKTIVEYREKESLNFIYDIEQSGSAEEAEHYLVEERGIDKEIVEALISKGLIRQDTKNNAVFVWGKTGRRVGADLQGTRPYKDKESGKTKTFKQIWPNSERNYGFNVSLGVPNKLFFFEAPIDLLSYWSLHKGLDNCRLVSMNGVKPQTVLSMIDHTFKSRGVSPTQIFLGVDNDAAGHKFFDRLNRSIMANNDGEKVLFENLIPNDLSIPKDNISIYKASAEKYGVDWRWIAAIHKVETNLSDTTEIANNLKYGRFFGNNVSPKENIHIEEAVEKCAKDLSDHTIDKSAFVESVIQSDDMEQQDLTYIREKVMRYYNRYRNDGYEVAENVEKDWNDELGRMRQEQTSRQGQRNQAELVR